MTAELIWLGIAVIAGVGTLFAWLAARREAAEQKAWDKLVSEDKPEGIDEKWEEDQFGEGGRR